MIYVNHVYHHSAPIAQDEWPGGNSLSLSLALLLGAFCPNLPTTWQPRAADMIYVNHVYHRGAPIAQDERPAGTGRDQQNRRRVLSKRLIEETLLRLFELRGITRRQLEEAA
jgi:hypothetical protein